MPDTERIIAQESRTFDSTLGDWTGDAVWADFGGPPFYGIAKFYLGPTKPSAQMTLNYPGLNVGPYGAFYLEFDNYNLIPPLLSRCTYKVSDGIYAFQGIKEIGSFPWTGRPFLHFDTPSDWNKLTAYLEITIEAIPPTESTMFCDNFSLVGEEYPPEKPTKIQYLPLVGIG